MSARQKGVLVRVRDSRDGDLPRIHAIYSHHVRTGLGSFEESPPDLAEMVRRRADILAKGMPYLVAELDDPAIPGGVAGYAYAGPYRPRSAYRYSVEDSIYVAPDLQRQGIGRQLLDELIARCTKLGYRQMVAVIGDSGNAGSIALHRSLGFQDAGVGKSFGFKHGRWVDIVWMQKALNGGDTRPPDCEGLQLSGH